MTADWTGLMRAPSAPAAKESCKPGSIAPIVKAVVEPCGRAFHYKQFVPTASEAAAVANKAGDAADYAMKEALRTKLDRKGLDLDDFYALMGLEEFGWKSTEEQIKEKWKLISFICHPDKSSPETRAYGEKRFKAMQLAYATLTDKQKRIGYDSALPFDEKIPKESEGTTEETFYKVYGPVFERNGRFSVDRPVPELGDKDATSEQFNAFYDFWLGFKSWRDFTHLDEHKNDDGTDRYTRRENDRKNAKLRAGAKKAETARVRKMVEDGMSKDPRIKKEKDAIINEAKARKDKIKNDKLAAKQAVEDKIKAEQQAKEDAINAEKNAKDAIKKNASNHNKAKKKLKRMVSNGRAGQYEQKQVDLVLAGASHEQMAAIVEAMCLHMSGPDSPALTEAEIASAKSIFRAAVRTLQSDEDNAAEDAATAALEAEANKKKSEEQAATDLRTWTPKEEEVLEQAVIKYYRKRDWPLMTNLVNDVSDYLRTKKEVIHKAREISERLGGFEDEDEASSAAEPVAAAEVVAVVAAPVGVEWSAEQASAFEAALKSVPASTPKRMEVIAPLVKGKNKKECVMRFKFLKAQAQAAGGRDWVWGHDWDAVPCFPGNVKTEAEAFSLTQGAPVISEWY